MTGLLTFIIWSNSWKVNTTTHITCITMVLALIPLDSFIFIPFFLASLEVPYSYFKYPFASLPRPDCLSQVLWAFMEIGVCVVFYKIVKLCEVPSVIALLPVLSNRLHLYNVRVVINDLPSVLLMFLAIYLILKNK